MKPLRPALALSSVVALSQLFACSSTSVGSRQIAGTAFDNEGTSKRSAALKRDLRLKGGGIPDLDAELETSRKNDLSRVIEQCDALLKIESAGAKQASNIGLGIAIVGLVAGSVIAPTLAAGNAAKSTIAAWSGVAGGTNVLQNEFRERGYDPQVHTLRIVAIKTSIRARTAEFFAASDDLERQKAVSNLTLDCLSS